MKARCLTLMAVAVLLVAACNGREEEQGPQTTIRFAAHDWTKTVIYDDLIGAFEEENPGLHVEFVSLEGTLGIDPRGTTPMPDDAAQRLVQAADVVHWLFSREMVELGLLRDLAPLIEADASFQPEDYFSGMLESAHWQGGIWALPALADIGVILYDRQAFDKAGVPYPKPGWSWDDFRATANAVTAREGDEVTRWGFVGSWPEPRIFAEGLAGSLLPTAESTDPPVPRFDDPQVIEAVRRYVELVLHDQVVPYVGSRGGAAQPADEEQALISGGRAAMWFGTSAAAEAMAIEDRNVGIVPFPADRPDAATNPLWTRWSLMVSAGTAQPEAAWRWLAFLSQQNLYREGMLKFYPPRRSVFEAAGLWAEMDEERAATLRYALDHSFSMQVTSAEYEPFDEAIDAILSGEKSVEQALSEAQAQAEAEIRDKWSGLVGASPAPTFVVAPPPQPKSETAVTISFSPRPAAYEFSLYRELAMRFHALHPDIAVEVMPALRGEGSPSLASLAAAADCFQWFPTLDEAADRAAILSLGPFLGADASFPVDDFWPGLWQPFTRQGEPWGLPADVALVVVEYNRDLLDTAGVAYPALDWTWDDFSTLAAALTGGEGEARRYGFAAEADDLAGLVLVTERLGARLLSLAEGSDPPAFTLDDPATVEAVRRYAELVASYGTGSGSLAGGQLQRLIDEGRVAIWTRSTAEGALRSDLQGASVGVAPLPQGPGGAYVEISGYFVSAQAGHPQACWQWIAFLSAQPEIVWGLPARRSVAESEAYRQQVGAERADAYLASVAAASRPSAFQTFSSEEWLVPGLFWYSRAYQQLLNGEATAQEALAAAQGLADTYRGCVLAGNHQVQGTWQTCARQIDPTLPGFLTGAGGE